MQTSQKQQRSVLGATVFTLVLGASFTYFEATHNTPIWPAVVLLGLVWGLIGIWILWRALRSSSHRLISHMNASISQPRRSQPLWLSTVVWLSAFLSPTVYFLLLLLANKFQIRVPQTFALLLLFLIPVVALLVCEWVVWSCSKTVGRRIGWMIFTLLTMLLQCATILAVLRVILVTAIGYAQ